MRSELRYRDEEIYEYRIVLTASGELKLVVVDSLASLECPISTVCMVWSIRFLNLRFSID